MLGRRVRGLQRRVCGLPHARVLLRRAPGLRERVHVMAGVLNPQRLMWLLGRLVRPVSPLWRINNLEACTPRCNLNWAPQAGEWHPHMTSATCTTPSHMRTSRHKARVHHRHPVRSVADRELQHAACKILLMGQLPSSSQSSQSSASKAAKSFQRGAPLPVAPGPPSTASGGTAMPAFWALPSRVRYTSAVCLSRDFSSVPASPSSAWSCTATA